MKKKPMYFIFWGDDADDMYNVDFTDPVNQKYLEDWDDWTLVKFSPGDEIVNLLTSYTGWVGFSTLTEEEYNLLLPIKARQDLKETAF